MQFNYYPGEIAAALCGYIGETDPAIVDRLDFALYQLKAICENPYNSDHYTDLYRALERFTEKQTKLKDCNNEQNERTSCDFCGTDFYTEGSARQNDGYALCPECEEKISFQEKALQRRKKFESWLKERIPDGMTEEEISDYIAEQTELYYSGSIVED